MTKKLNMLCLYGFNNNVGCFQYMMRHFKTKFENDMNFQVIEAPFPIDTNHCPAEQVFLDRGFKAPFYSWLRYIPTHEEAHAVLNA